MTRPIRSLVTLLAVVVALVGAAACGIDEDKVAGGVQANGRKRHHHDLDHRDHRARRAPTSRSRTSPPT